MHYHSGLCGEMAMFWFYSFSYQRIFKELVTNPTFKEKGLRYIVTWFLCFFMKSCKGPLLCTFFLQPRCSLFAVYLRPTVSYRGVLRTLSNI